MSTGDAGERRLPRRTPVSPGAEERAALEAARHRWVRVLLWLMAIGAVVGTSLRRPLAGDYGPWDLAWAALYAVLAGLLVVPYQLWQRRAEAESRALLACIRKDTLVVYPQPGAEQRVPLIGVARLERGGQRDGATELKTVRPAAMGGSYWVDLDAERADEVIAFVNRALERHAWHEL